MPLTLSFDNSTIADLALAVAKLTPLEAAATLRELKARPSFRGVNWDVVMAGAVQAAAVQARSATAPASSSVLIAGLQGSGPTAVPLTPTVESFLALAASPLDVTDLGGVSNPAIYDVVGGANAANDTGALDLTAWRAVFFWFLCSGGTSALQVQFMDDAGVAYVTPIAPAAALTGQGALGPGVAAGGMTGAGFIFQGPLPRRARFFCGAAGVGNTVRLRIEGRR